MHWRVKGIIQKVLGTIPGGAMLHFHLQRRFGGLRSFERELSVKVDDWAIMARHLRNAGVDFSRMRGFEIGTGWYPTFPFACYLAGARKITTCDLNPHLREDLTRACVEELEKFLPVIAEAAGADPDAVAQRYHALGERTRGGEEPTAASGGVVDYHAPAGAARTALHRESQRSHSSHEIASRMPYRA